MTDHDCKHEADLAVMAENIKDVKASIEKLLKLVQGNGNDGLTGKVKSITVQLVIQWGLLMGLCAVIVWKRIL